MHDCHSDGATGPNGDHDDCDGDCASCDEGTSDTAGRGPTIFTDAMAAMRRGDLLGVGRADLHDAAAVGDFAADTRAEMERRDFAKVLATMGGLTAVGSLAAPLAGLTRVFDRSYTGPIYSDGVHLVDGEGNRLTEDALAEGEQTTVFPEPRPGIEDAPTLLVRLPQGDFGGETRSEYTVSGYAAYSKVCTHAGCMVSNEEDGIVVCPCHFGKFDPAKGAQVVGGPPPRPLPQLPLTLSSDGYLVATGDFEGPVGPGGGE